MPDSTVLLTALRNDLVTLGLVRRPADAGTAPPMHVEPRDGAPGPGGREGLETTGDLVVTLRLAGELGEGAFDAYRRRASFDVIYRSSSTAGLKAGRALDNAIRSRLTGGATYGVGVILDPAGTPVHILQAVVFAGLSPVADTDGIRTERAAYVLEALAA